MQVPVARSQFRTKVSSEPDTTCSPSREKCTLLTDLNERRGEERRGEGGGEGRRGEGEGRGRGEERGRERRGEGEGKRQWEKVQSGEREGREKRGREGGREGGQ